MSTSKESSSKTRTRSGMSLANAAGITMLILGLVALTVSIIYVSTILAFIGLGLVFWGFTFTYIQTGEYVKESVLNATETSLLTILNQTLKELDYRGRAIYLPPKYLNDPETNKAYVPKQSSGRLPSPDQIQRLELQDSLRSSQGILIAPPGAELAKLFEDTLETSFTRVNLDYLQDNLPKLLVEDLEIASNVEMQKETNRLPNQLEAAPTQATTEQNIIHVHITSSVYKNANKETQQPSSINSTFGSPLTSAIACALAKATGKPIIIENQETSEDGSTIHVQYRILEEEQAKP